jgi:hypothetical protein
MLEFHRLAPESRIVPAQWLCWEGNDCAWPEARCRVVATSSAGVWTMMLCGNVVTFATHLGTMHQPVYSWQIRFCFAIYLLDV